MRQRHKLSRRTICAALLLIAAATTTARADIMELPVIVTGADMPDWTGRPVNEIYVLVYDADAGTWSTIPQQLDEREILELATCLNLPILGNIDEHLAYVTTGTEGNGLDDDDELVVRTADAAPLGAWPAGVEDLRYEVAIDDGIGGTIGFCYIFAATAPPLPPAPADHVLYSHVPLSGTLEDTTVLGQTYRVHYAARWRLDEIAVLAAGGGTSEDMIDRVKRREGADPDGRNGEDEELWDSTSCFLGQKDGPVRVIREIQGAASGVNTTQTAYFYRSFFVERFNLRVHSIPNIMSYVDYNASVAPLTYYNPSNPGGVTIDGSADPAINLTLNDWEMVSHATVGGVFYHRREIVPPPAQSTTMFYWDAGTFADTTGDDEPGRFGCHGIVYTDLATTDPPGSEAVFVQTTIPLAAGTGNVGATLADEIDNPPFGLLTSQLRPAAIDGDFDGDGDVDLSDFSQFSLCFGGANTPPAASCPPGVDADFDDDGDVDLGDFSTFSLNFTGPL